MTLEAAVCPCNPAAGAKAPCLVLTLPQCIYSSALRKREVVESPSLEVFKICVGVGTGFSGGLGSARLTVALNDLKGLFQPK